MPWWPSTAASASTSVTSPSGTARASRPGAPPRRSPWSAAIEQVEPGWQRRSTRTCCSRRPPTARRLRRGGVARPAARRRHQPVRPGLEAYRDVLRDEVAPHARPDEQCGLSWLPGRRGDLRAARSPATPRRPSPPRRSTTSAWRRSPPSARSTARSAPEVVGTDDLPAIYTRTARGPGAAALERAPSIVAACEAAIARARAAMPEWFDRLPAADCVVKATDVRRQRRTTSRRPTTAAAAAPSTSTPPTRALGPLRAGGDGVPRGHPGPPPPARHRRRAHRRPELPQARSSTPTPRAGGSTPSGWPTRWASTPRPLDRLGMLTHGLDARLPPRRRHRPARPGLEPAAGVDYMVANSRSAWAGSRPRSTAMP